MDVDPAILAVFYCHQLKTIIREYPETFGTAAVESVAQVDNLLLLLPDAAKTAYEATGDGGASGVSVKLPCKRAISFVMESGQPKRLRTNQSTLPKALDRSRQNPRCPAPDTNAAVDDCAANANSAASYDLAVPSLFIETNIVDGPVINDRSGDDKSGGKPALDGACQLQPYSKAKTFFGRLLEQVVMLNQFYQNNSLKSVVDKMIDRTQNPVIVQMLYLQSAYTHNLIYGLLSLYMRDDCSAWRNEMKGRSQEAFIRLWNTHQEAVTKIIRLGDRLSFLETNCPGSGMLALSCTSQLTYLPKDEMWWLLALISHEPSFEGLLKQLQGCGAKARFKDWALCQDVAHSEKLKRLKNAPFRQTTDSCPEQSHWCDHVHQKPQPVSNVSASIQDGGTPRAPEAPWPRTQQHHNEKSSHATTDDFNSPEHVPLSRTSYKSGSAHGAQVNPPHGLPTDIPESREYNALPSREQRHLDDGESVVAPQRRDDFEAFDSVRPGPFSNSEERQPEEFGTGQPERRPIEHTVNETEPGLATTDTHPMVAGMGMNNPAESTGHSRLVISDVAQLYNPTIPIIASDGAVQNDASISNHHDTAFDSESYSTHMRQFGLTFQITKTILIT
jgi:hypothetical protein